MNLLLHGIGAEDAPSPIVVNDALMGIRATAFDMVSAEPAVRAQVVALLRERRG